MLGIRVRAVELPGVVVEIEEAGRVYRIKRGEDCKLLVFGVWCGVVVAVIWACHEVYKMM